MAESQDTARKNVSRHCLLLAKCGFIGLKQLASLANTPPSPERPRPPSARDGRGDCGRERFRVRRGGVTTEVLLLTALCGLKRSGEEAVGTVLALQSSAVSSYSSSSPSSPSPCRAGEDCPSRKGRRRLKKQDQLKEERKWQLWLLKEQRVQLRKSPKLCRQELRDEQWQKIKELKTQRRHKKQERRLKRHKQRLEFPPPDEINKEEIKKKTRYQEIKKYFRLVKTTKDGHRRERLEVLKGHKEEKEMLLQQDTEGHGLSGPKDPGEGCSSQWEDSR
ncbi:uncharacterized protein LOC120550783 [Perca fluviatilis]|uniref:uncharacterized protein LOC120550783 n=1 Tax=Perca fluviatilis TaxID=8168 RepID=UPI001966A07D|nr:uncharacterized protein LOC120550783 [Perca fluviatilis]